MLAENKTIFDLLGISKYHAAGKLGQGAKSDVILDNPDDGHGTKIMALGLEVAPLAPEKLLSRFDMKNSVDWIFAHRNEIASINCSWHSWINPEFERLEALDIPVFAASGNQRDDEINYPGSLPWVISVGAWSMYRNMLEVYSNYGPGLDCLIPDNIYWLSGKGEPMTDDGTSFCSPVAARMLRLTGRDYTRQEAFDYIHAHCLDRYTPGYDIKSGYGIFALPDLEVESVAVPSWAGKKIEVDSTVMFEGSSVPAGIITVDGQGKTVVELATLVSLLGLKKSFDNTTKTATISR